MKNEKLFVFAFALVLSLTFVVSVTMTSAQETLSVISTSASSGSLNVPVSVSLDNSLDVDGFQFDISFPSDILTFKDVSADRAGTTDYNLISPGLLRVAGLGTVPAGTGALVNLIFDVSLSASGIYPISLDNVVLGSTDLGRLVSAAVNGTITITQIAQCTDTDRDYYTLEATPAGDCCGTSGNEACLGGNDCNDNNVDIYPGAAEVCNGIDDNCANGIDEGLGTTTCGLGICNHTIDNCIAGVPQTCNPLEGATAESCEDNTGYNGLDDNCDGAVDLDCNSYCDQDSDGYTPNIICLLSLQYPISLDCDDTNAAINPGATETCNGIDDNCANGIDEGVQSTFYQDSDSDSYGNPAVSTLACTAPTGYIANNTDNCPDKFNPDQANADNNDGGDVCDPCPSIAADTCNPAYSAGQNYNVTSSLILNNSANTVSVTIPANAAGQDVSVSFTKITTGKDFEICTKTTSGATSCFYPINSEIYSFEPEITFIQPIDLRFYYGSNPNCPIGKCDIFWYNETSAKWTQQRANCTAVPGWCVLNTSFGNAINHFSEYALAAYTDDDSDGYYSDVDCNDSDSAINPGAEEICNGIDDNCDGQIDENYVCDTTAPIIEYVDIFPSISSDSITITKQVSDDMSGVASVISKIQYCVDMESDCSEGPVVGTVSATYQPDDNLWTAVYYFGAGLLDGAYLVSDIVTDNKGNSLEEPDAYAILDRTAPIASIVSILPAQVETSQTVTIKASAKDATSGISSVIATDLATSQTAYLALSSGSSDPNQEGIYQGAITSQLPAGIHNVDVEVRDYSEPQNAAVASGIYTVYTHVCGNGIVGAGEQCDDGNTNNNDACKNNCMNNICGDGIIYTGVEQCDDGNTADGDGCSSICMFECTDADGDGYGTAGSSGCTYPEVDCNDANADVNPGATEICNGIDDDCDGQIDENYTCDSAPPSVTNVIISPSISNSAITITKTVTDDLSGVASVTTNIKDSLGTVVGTVSLSLVSGNNLNGAWQGAYNIAVPDGTYTISDSVTDVSGKSAEIIDGTVIFDRTAPTAFIISIAPYYANPGANVTIKASAKDTTSGISTVSATDTTVSQTRLLSLIQGSSAPGQTGNYSGNLTAVVPYGMHNVNVTVKDNANNPVTVSGSFAACQSPFTISNQATCIAAKGVNGIAPTWDALTSTCTLNDNYNSCGNNGLNIGANNITIDCQGHSITGIGTLGYGIEFNSKNNVTVKNCAISNFRYGIVNSGGSNNKILNNIIHDNYVRGIATGGSNNLLEGNEIYSNGYITGDYDGGIAVSGTNNIIRNNIIKANNNLSVYYKGQIDISGSGHQIIGNVIADGKSVGIVLSASNVLISNNTLYNNTNYPYGQIYVTGSNNLISYNNITRARSGIFMNAVNNIITKNTFTYMTAESIFGCNYGFFNITDNYFENVATGVGVCGNYITPNVLIEGNTFVNASTAVITSSPNTTIKNNIISKSVRGIVMSSPYGVSENNTITGPGNIGIQIAYRGNAYMILANNTISGMSDSGIKFDDLQTQFVTVINNELTKNYMGISVIYMWTNKGNFTITENNIYNNTKWQISSDGALEVSDNISSGNWWGRTTPPYFIAGVDSNLATVKDDYPYSIKSAWLDSTPPVIEFLKQGMPGNNNWYVSAVNLAIRAYDAIPGVLNLSHTAEKQG